MSEPKVGDLQNPSGVDETVTGFELAMVNNFTVMQIDHALDQIANQGGDEHVVQSIIGVA